MTYDSGVRLLAPLLTSLVVLTASPPAARAVTPADQKVRCANAYEQAQRTRNEGHLLSSRAHLLVCTEDSCPAVLRTECIKWLGEVDQAMPTVLIVADVGGKEVADVAVRVDGKPLLESLDGKALPIDPGTHTFRFVRAGSAPIEQTVLIREGEKRRPLVVSFAAPNAPPPPAPERPKVSSSSVPAATWVLGGVGVIALGVSAPLYISAYGQKSTLDADPCAAAGTCDPERASAVKRRFAFGDVAAVIGVAALGGAALVWLTTPSTPVAAGIAPLPGGIAGTFRVAF